VLHKQELFPVFLVDTWAGNMIDNMTAWRIHQALNGLDLDTAATRRIRKRNRSYDDRTSPQTVIDPRKRFRVEFSWWLLIAWWQQWMNDWARISGGKQHVGFPGMTARHSPAGSSRGSDSCWGSRHEVSSRFGKWPLCWTGTLCLDTNRYRQTGVVHFRTTVTLTLT